MASSDSPRSEASQGFLYCGVVRKHPVERGQLEHNTDLLVGGGQPQVALRAADLLQRRDDGAEASAVDEADPLQVDDYPGLAVLHSLADRVLQCWSAGHVQAPGRSDHGDPVVDLAALYLETHLMGTQHGGSLWVTQSRLEPLYTAGRELPRGPSAPLDRGRRGGPGEAHGAHSAEPRLRIRHRAQRGGGQEANRGQRLRAGAARRSPPRRVWIRPSGGAS